MKHLTKILFDNGYKMYRRGYTFKNQNSESRNQALRTLEKQNVIITNQEDDKITFYWEHGDINKINDLSTMVFGGLSYWFVKDEDFENPFIWGLDEKDKPPTLKYPRPKIKVKRIKENETIIETEIQQSSMDICLSKEKHEDILEAIKTGKEFYYDLT